MSMTAEDYRAQLAALQPPGRALPAEASSDWQQLLTALADELARIDARGDDLVDESDPRSTNELLPDWERVAGLPDPCVPVGQSLRRRRDALVGRLTGTGGQSRQYFIDLAQSIGFQVTITEFVPHDVTLDVGVPIYGELWRFAWQVNAPNNTVTTADITSGVDEAIRDWGNELLECVLSARSPAHTQVIFAYG